jgi:hypothetical protein
MTRAARYDQEQRRRDGLDRKVLAALRGPEQAAVIAVQVGASKAAVVASLSRLVREGRVVQVGGPAPAEQGEATGTRYAVVPAGKHPRDVIQTYDPGR